MRHVETIRNWYGKYERPLSSFSLIFGFIFDAVTLKRVDTLWENVWILGHILIVAVFIILIHLMDNEEGDESNPSKKHFWFVNILQFFFGGILSTYLVFYFRSSDIFTTWPFILLLSMAFIANESMKRHYVRLTFQTSLLFLSIYSFAIFILPVLLHNIGVWVFLLSGLASLATIAIFVYILLYYKKKKRNMTESKKLITLSVLSIFIIVNLLYFTNLIPPLPLSIKDAEIYHSIDRNKAGSYVVSAERTGLLDYFKIFKDFHKMLGAPVYAYSAIFSPAKLDLNIVHEWQYYDETSRKWVTDSVIRLPVIGGREDGYRTYSMRQDLHLGKWRVNIETLNGQVIGRLRFNVTDDTDTPGLQVITKT